jgi:cell division protein FtsI (penicillin-binding protein 3)
MPTLRRKPPALERERARTRVTSLLTLTVVLFAAVGARLVHLQVIARDDLADQALDQRLVSYTIPAARGTIFDRNGRDLALDVPRDFVFVDPLLVLAPYRDTYLDNLSEVLGVAPDELAPLLERAQNDDGEDIRYRQLWSEPLTATQASAIRTLRLPGVALETRTVRIYPRRPRRVRVHVQRPAHR